MFNKYFKIIKKELGPLLVAILVSWLMTTFIIANAKVPTSSMEHTIKTGSRLIGNRLSYIKEEPMRKDIIIFRAPDMESIYYVKRIIGLPGDVVEIMPTDLRTGQVYINGHPIYEEYLKEPMIVDEYMKFVVPENAYFCMGDNRNDSFDARYWEQTYVRKDKIVAKVIVQYWPHMKQMY